MSARPSFLGRISTWLIAGAALGGAVWLGSSLMHSPTRRHSLASQEATGAGVDRTSSASLEHAAPASVPRVENTPAAALTAPTEAEFLNRHYANQVVAEVKLVDTPEQFEQKVRAMDPEYAKILDENAAEERKNAARR